MEAKLNVEIGAQLSNLNSEIAKAVSTVTSGSNQMDAAVSKTERSFKLLNNTKFTFGANYLSASRQLATEAQKTSMILSGSMVRSSNQAAFALTNLGRVAQDAPFGFMGIQNNLNPLLESFQMLKQQTGSTGAAFKALTSSLMGPAGIGIALSVVSAGILFYQQYARNAKNKTEELTESFKDQQKEFSKSQYEKAYTEVNELTRNIQLAKQGLLDKNVVLKQYNEGIGVTIGKVNNLNDAEDKLIRNGDAYLKLMFLKANAEFAFKKAAEESYNLSIKQAEVDAKRPQISKDFNVNADRTSKSTKQVSLNLREILNDSQRVSGGLDGVNSSFRNISKTLETDLIDESQLNTLGTASEKALTAAEKAQNAVVDFAKQMGFSLNGIFGGSGGKTPIADFARQAEIDYEAIPDVMGRLNTDLDDFLLDYEKTAAQLHKTPLIPIGPIKAQSSSVITELEKLAANIERLAGESISNSLIGLGTAIGDAMASGTNAFEAGGRALLGAFGGFLSDYGKLLIKYGAAAVLKGKLDLAALVPGAGIPAGIAAIAAGVALVAAGAAISSFASGSGSSSGDSGSGRPRKIPGFANGVQNFAGGMAVVGERGPELVTLPTGSNVIPNHNLSQMGGGNINLNASIGIAMDELYVRLEQTGKRRGRLGVA